MHCAIQAIIYSSKGHTLNLWSYMKYNDHFLYSKSKKLTDQLTDKMNYRVMCMGPKFFSPKNHKTELGKLDKAESE